MRVSTHTCILDGKVSEEGLRVSVVSKALGTRCCLLPTADSLPPGKAYMGRFSNTGSDAVVTYSTVL